MAQMNNIPISLYKKFRAVNELTKADKFRINKRFDEPTYFSFRLLFAQDNDNVYNVASNSAVYDMMPHPLFSYLNSESYMKPVENRINTIIEEKLSYSAIDYLVNANEPTRADMLREFISKFNDLQSGYPYYFQSVDGISELLKIDPQKGQRILNDKKISITCLEGLDLRMSYLMNLYRKIAWDDVYQRWVLPDMMRYFTLKIYLAEFRTFHIPQTSSKQKDGYGQYAAAGTEQNFSYNEIEQNMMAKEVTGQYPNMFETTISEPASLDMPLYLTILDDILPTWEITCEMCEFDINDITFEHLSNLNVGSDPIQGAVKFGIKVGNIKELQTYPVFQHRFLSDRKLNGVNRAGDIISTMQDVNNNYLYPASLQIAQNRNSDKDDYHVSTTPYNETRNTKNMYGQRGPGSDKMWGNEDDNTVQPNPTQPETWVGNAIGFGTAYAKSFVNKIVDKAKMFSVPNLGVSFNEVKSVLQAKDIVGAFGLIRKGINEVVESYGNAPSSRLEQPLQTDDVMRNFLVALSKSEATDDDTKLLQGAANMVLSDTGTWEKIKDYSLATDLVGKRETNTIKDLQGTQQYRSIIEQQAAATSISEDLSKNSGMPQVMPNAASKALSGESEIAQTAASSELTENIKTNPLTTGKASSNLGSGIQNDSISSETASSKLSSSITSDSKDKIVASANLSNTDIKQNVKSQDAASSKLSADIKNTTLSSTQASQKLSGEISEKMKSSKASGILSSQISESAMNTDTNKTSGIDTNAKINQDTKVKSTTIHAGQIIEAEPSRILINKMDVETLKQPIVSKATNNKIEEQKVESITSSKATTSKIEKQEVLNNENSSKATNQELFSK